MEIILVVIIVGAIVLFGLDRNDSYGRISRLLWFLYNKVLPIGIIALLILSFLHII